MTKTLTFQDEVVKLTKIKRKNGEKDQEWLKRCMVALGDLHDETFEKISGALYDWHTAAVEAHNAKLAIPGFPDMEEAVEEEDAEDEPEELQDSDDSEDTDDEGQEEPVPVTRAAKPSEEEPVEEPQLEQEDNKGRVKQPRVRDSKGNLVKRTTALRMLVIQQPNLSNDDVLERCGELGIDLGKASILATAYHTKATVKMMEESYGLKVPNDSEGAPEKPKESKKPATDGAKQQKRRGRPPKKAVDIEDDSGENDSDE